MQQNGYRLFPSCHTAAILWKPPRANITPESVVKDHMTLFGSGGINMSVPSIGITELTVVGGVVVMAGHMVLTSAAVVAAIVVWRKRS